MYMYVLLEYSDVIGAKTVDWVIKNEIAYNLKLKPYFLNFLASLHKICEKFWLP